MQRKALAEMNYPPPPPLSHGRSQKKLFAVIAIVIIAIAGVAGAYYLTSNNSSSTNPSSSPIPSQTLGQTSSPATSTSPSVSAGTSTNPSSSPTPSQTTSSSPGSGIFAGYRAGSWANYTVKSYDANGVVTEQNALSYAVSEGTRNGVACLIMVSEGEMGQGDAMRITYWISKSNSDSIHLRSQMFTNGVVVSDTESDINASDFDLSGLSIPDSVTVVGQETVTVPAGTFNCEKDTTTMTFYGLTSVSTRWVSSNIPIMGLVKDQSIQEGVLQSTTELIAYGG